MPSDTSLNKRDTYFRKTIPQTGRVRKKTATITRVEKEYMKRLRFRSRFELQLAKGLADNKVKFEYESKKFLYVPKPRTYTPDFYLVESDIYIEAKGSFR